MTRDPAIYLAPGEPRCDPGKPCDRQATCGRRLATVPPGETLTDFSVNLWWSSGVCMHWVRATTVRPAASAPPRRVFKDLGGES